jgi:hypothetical protein
VRKGKRRNIQGREGATSPRRRYRAGALTVGIFLAVSLAACGGDMVDVMDASKQAVAEDRKAAPSPPPRGEVGQVLLVVDDSASMAGFVAPEGRPRTRFSTTLGQISSHLGTPEVATFRQPAAASSSTTLESLLEPHPGGIGRSFETPASYCGSHNPDDRLFRAVVAEGARSLVFLTDGVFSAPEAAGVLPVVAALEEAIAQGWSVGILPLDSQYHGIPCDRCGLACGARRVFHSESRVLSGGSGSLSPMVCDEVGSRPFYAFVLSPSDAVFESLRDFARAHLQMVEGFLFSRRGGAVFLQSASWSASIEPGEDADAAEAPLIDGDTKLSWLMVDRSGLLTLGLDYALAPTLPAQALQWRRELAVRPWEDGRFRDEWTPVAGDLRFGELVPGVGSVRDLTWSSFTDDLRRFRQTVADLDGSVQLDGPAREALGRLNAFEPQDERHLFCRHMASRERRPLRDPELANLYALATLDAMRRRDSASESSYGTLSQLFADPQLEPLLAQRDQLRRGSNDGSVLDDPAGGAHVAQGGTAEAAQGQTIEIMLDPARVPAGTHLVRIRLVPELAAVSPQVAALTTHDDSDFSSLTRTFRFEDLVTSLTQITLAQTGGTPVYYVTLFDRRPLDDGEEAPPDVAD